MIRTATASYGLRPIKARSYRLDERERRLHVCGVELVVAARGACDVPGVSGAVSYEAALGTPLLYADGSVAAPDRLRAFAFPSSSSREETYVEA
jgi:hypothetical protein